MYQELKCKRVTTIPNEETGVPESAPAEQWTIYANVLPGDVVGNAGLRETGADVDVVKRFHFVTRNISLDVREGDLLVVLDGGEETDTMYKTLLVETWKTTKAVALEMIEE